MSEKKPPIRVVKSTQNLTSEKLGHRPTPSASAAGPGEPATRPRSSRWSEQFNNGDDVIGTGKQ